MTKGRGWHGERARHRLAAIRGIKTKRRLSDLATRNITIVKMALRKMRSIIRWLNPLWDSRGSTWQIDVRQQDKMTRELEDIMETLEMAAFPKDAFWLGPDSPSEIDEGIETAKQNLAKAWSSKTEQDRVTYIEMAREELHTAIVGYLIDRNAYDMGSGGI